MAMELIDAMAKIRKQHPVMPLVIRVFGNPEWLSDVYLEAGAIPIRANLGHFLRGFNSHDSLVEFVAEDIGMRIPAYRMRGRSIMAPRMILSRALLISLRCYESS